MNWIPTYADLLRRRCRHCGRIFTIESDHDRARYCSPNCRQAARRAALPRRPARRRCAHCAAEFTDTPGRVGRPRLYCSTSCRQKAYRARLRDRLNSP